MNDEIRQERSPKSPKQSLEEALQIIGGLHRKIGRAKVAVETAVKALGYAGVNGAALTTLGALTSYGLVDRDRGVGLSVSELAIQLIHPTDPRQHEFALADAALKPKVFMELYTEGFHDSDVDVIRNHLIQKGFTQDRASVSASVYYKNYLFAKLSNFRSHGDMVNEKRASVVENRPIEHRLHTNVPPEPRSIYSNLVAEALATRGASPAPSQTSEAAIPIGDGMFARIPYPMSEEDFQMFIDTLQLWKRRLVRLEKPEQNPTGEPLS